VTEGGLLYLSAGVARLIVFEMSLRHKNAIARLAPASNVYLLILLLFTLKQAVCVLM
jgi:hypothetical protein